MSRDVADKDGAETHVFELSLFLITAARGCVDEPKMYGPLRLIEARSRLADIYGKSDKLKPDPFMARAKAEIDANKYQVMASEETFVAFLDRMVVEFSDEMKRRYQRPTL